MMMMMNVSRVRVKHVVVRRARVYQSKWTWTKILHIQILLHSYLRKRARSYFFLFTIRNNMRFLSPLPLSLFTKAAAVGLFLLATTLACEKCSFRLVVTPNQPIAFHACYARRKNVASENEPDPRLVTGFDHSPGDCCLPSLSPCRRICTMATFNQNFVVEQACGVD